MPASIRESAFVILAFIALTVAGPAGAGPGASGAEAQDQDPDSLVNPVHWQAMVKDVPPALLKRDLLDWADELAAKLDKAGVEELAVSLEVFLRAGQPERVSAVIPGLSRKRFIRVSGAGIGDRLIRLRYFEQARLWFDAFPADASQDEIASLIKWMESQPRARLADGSDTPEAYLEAKHLREKTGRPYRAGKWSEAYWRHLQDKGKLGARVAVMEQLVRKSPSDAGEVFEYLSARSVLPEDKRPPIDWLAGVCRLERALDNWVLAKRLGWDKQADAAIALYDRSLACPVTDYDRTWFNRASESSMFVEPEGVERVLRQWTKAALAKACFDARKLDRAQKLVEELTGKKDGAVEDLGPFLFAGQVQGASGQRVVENRILKAEKENRNSARYWLNRAQYYLGRKELEQAEEAYRAAMKLPPDAQRFEVVRDYGWFLANRNRHAEAERIFRAEIERGKAAQADFWLNQLEILDGKGGVRVSWDEPLVWGWLAKRKPVFFGQSEQWRLEKTARKAAATPETWAAFEKKARELAAAPCPPTLQYCLGSILHGRGQPEEGLRLMAEAYSRWPNDAYPPGRDVAERLWRAMLAGGDPAGAERVITKLLDDPSRGLDPEWLGQAAVAVAQAKAADLAVGIWQRKMALDLTDQRGLEELAAAGLGERLRGLYSALAKRAPDNRPVAAALKKLERR